MMIIASSVRAQNALTSKALRQMAQELRQHISRPETEDAKRAFHRIVIALDQHAADLNAVTFE